MKPDLLFVKQKYLSSTLSGLNLPGSYMDNSTRQPHFQELVARSLVSILSLLLPLLYHNCSRVTLLGIK